MVKETTPIAMTRTRERASEALPSREPKAKKAKKVIREVKVIKVIKVFVESQEQFLYTWTACCVL